MRIMGIDEVGRGCWAGPLVAGAVVLGSPIAGLRDSKKLSRTQRQRLALIIQDQASCGLGWVTHHEIDALGLTQAVRLAMKRAVEACKSDYDEMIVDGRINYLTEYARSSALIKADDSIPAVSAASIIAKVARDEYMADLSRSYPGYGFEKNVGYGTALHISGLQNLGVTDIHRKSFRPIRNALGKIV